METTHVALIHLHCIAGNIRLRSPECSTIILLDDDDKGGKGASVPLLPSLIPHSRLITSARNRINQTKSKQRVKTVKSLSRHDKPSPRDG